MFDLHKPPRCWQEYFLFFSIVCQIYSALCLHTPESLLCELKTYAACVLCKTQDAGPEM